MYLTVGKGAKGHHLRHHTGVAAVMGDADCSGMGTEEASCGVAYATLLSFSSCEVDFALVAMSEVPLPRD